MKCKKVNNSSRKDDSWEIESVDSQSRPSCVNIEVSPCDRPGISSLNIPRNVLQSSVNAKSPVLMPKNDFIKKWLMDAEIERNESTLSASCLSVIENSPPGVKRSPRSPLRQLNDLKRRKLSIESNGFSPKKSENQKENQEKSVLSPRSRLVACRAAIFGASRRVSREKTAKNSYDLIEENGLDKLKQLERERSVISQCGSVVTKNIEIESASSTQSEEVPKIIDDNSINSSPKLQEIDSRFSDDGEEPVLIDNEEDNESNLKETIDELIEDPEGEFPEVQNRLQSFEKDTRIHSDDPDRTYFCEGSEVNQAIDECASQKISDITLTPQDTNLRGIFTPSDNEISVEASPPPRKTDGEIYPSINHKTVRRKKKAKKGSMLERLQTLVNGKISFLRMWRHQMSQARFKGTCNQCVIIKISKFSTIYGRPLFEGIIIKDNFNLIDKSISNSSDPSADVLSNSLNKTVKLLTIPEIVGQISVKDKNALKLYPPWEIMDADKLILSVLYFNLINDDSENSQIVGKSMENNIIMQEFDCFCLKNGRIMNSCSEKFFNSKPTAIDFIFK